MGKAKNAFSLASSLSTSFLSLSKKKTRKSKTGGPSLEAAFCSAGLGMINYMTPLEGLAAVEER